MDQTLFVNVFIVSAILLQANCFAKNKQKGADLTPEEKAELDRLSKLPGHMKPMGSAGPFFDLYTMDGFPTTRDFFNKYVIPSTPLLMKNAAKISPAFTKWTDEYFLNHSDSNKITVFAEGRKKEIRTAPGGFMTFHKFVQKYNTTDMYMVNGLPKHLRPDVIIPPPMQCDPVARSVIDVVTWFSSGGTKSVLHNDDVDNINCLYRGDKTLVFVNPHDDPEMWNRVIDRPNGGYSSLDVDAVDFTKFPDLGRVRYARVDMTAGDCLYIPYRWYHQVNSFGSNLAVNLWWTHETAKFFDLNDEKCGDFTGRNTIANLTWPGMDDEGGSESPGGGAYGGEQNVDNPPTDQFLEQFNEENGSSEDTSSESSEEVPDDVTAEGDKEEGEGSGEGQSMEFGEESITDKIYRSAVRLAKPIHISGIKRYVLRKMPPPNDVWDDRCQDLLMNYFGMLDQNKDTVITSEDADLFYAADENTLDQNYDVTAFFDEDLRSALVSASIARDKELVLQLVERGEIDKEQIATIFGNILNVPTPDSLRDEL